MSKENTSFAQRSLKKVYFDHKDMDYYLSWILGREIYNGSDHKECLSAARRITKADAESWGREWRALAKQVQDQAEHALKNGQQETACNAFLRASTYYRAPLFLSWLQSIQTFTKVGGRCSTASEKLQSFLVRRLRL